jgi:hypothetical protein
MAQLRRLDEFGMEIPSTEPQGIAGPDYFPDGLPKPIPQGGAAPPPPSGGFDLEAIRAQLGFGKTNMADPQAWLKANQNIAGGATIRGDKMYDPSGKYLADVVSNMKGGGTASQFLDGIDSGGKARAPKPVKLKPPKGAKGAPSPMAAQAGANASTNVNASSSSVPSMNDVASQLAKLFPNGAFNQGLVNSRVSSANDAIERARKSRMATNKATLADRGILEQAAPTMNRMDEDLFDMQAGAVRDIHADESRAADSRMMQALTTAAGLTTDQAKLVIDRFRAENDNKLGMGRLNLDTELGRGELALGNRNSGITERLGLGNLALGNLNAVNDYNLGLGNLTLGGDRLNADIERGDSQDLIDLLRIYMGGAQTTTGGAR